MPDRLNLRRELKRAWALRTTVSVILLTTTAGYLPFAAAQTTLKTGWSVAELYADRYAVEKGMAIAEGDIFIAESDAEGRFHQRGLGVNGGLGLWTDGIIPYQVASDLSPDVEASVVAAIAHWNANSSITLVERSALGAAPDYVDFINGPGCASWVGKQGGNQPVWVSGSCNTGSIIHEIGHAIGLLHEHTRSDRDQFVQISHQNIQQGKEFNFDVVTAGVANLGAYDYASIMHYGEYFFSANGNPTLVPMDSDADIGQRVAASSGDLAAIDTLYGSDLSLVVQVDSPASVAGQNQEVIMNVTNNGLMGAHDLQVFATLPGGETSFSSVDAWQCQSEQESNVTKVVCSLAKLSAGQNTQFVLLAASTVSADSVNASLVSKTHDSNVTNNGSNNGSSVATDTPELGEALKEDAVNTLAATGGGGGATFIMLLGLLVAVLRRAGFPVVSGSQSQLFQALRRAR